MQEGTHQPIIVGARSTVDPDPRFAALVSGFKFPADARFPIVCRRNDRSTQRSMERPLGYARSGSTCNHKSNREHRHRRREGGALRRTRYMSSFHVERYAWRAVYKKMSSVHRRDYDRPVPCTRRKKGETARVNVMVQKIQISPFSTENFTRLSENSSSNFSRLVNLLRSSTASNRSS